MARKKKPAGCKRRTIRFKTKRGKVIQFSGRSGASCGPRPKPSTAHLRHYKSAMRAAAKHCKGKPKQAFRNCIATQMPK